MYCHLKSYSCTSSGTRILPESRNLWQYPSKVQRADLTCDVIKKLAPFALSKLWILVADWSMRWSRDTFLLKLRQILSDQLTHGAYLNQRGKLCPTKNTGTPIFLTVSNKATESQQGAPPARAPKQGKTPIMVACHCYRRRPLFFKIELRPRSCRSYHIWHPCTFFCLSVCFFLYVSMQ